MYYTKVRFIVMKGFVGGFSIQHFLGIAEAIRFDSNIHI